jgi:hypothetical protein
MKNNFANLILESSPVVQRHYCSCNALVNHKISNSVCGRRGGPCQITYKQPFAFYSSTIQNECNKICSNKLILEYEEE